ncbi:interleukin-21-like [Spinachia spinachia]
MKPVVFCLLAAWGGSLVGAATPPEPLAVRKLREVLGHLRRVNASQQHNKKMLNTPPQFLEDHCCLSALQCFQLTLKVQFNAPQDKLYKSLKQQSNARLLCPSANSGGVQAKCQTCDSHPKETVEVFFNRLGSVIEKGISRLRMK